MKKNGFAFVETIVAVIVLASSLLLLYSSFNNVLQSNKTRVYYDDLNFIYRSWYIYNSINTKFPTNLDNIKQTWPSSEQTFLTLYKKNDENNGIYDDLSNFFNFLDVKQIILIKENDVKNITACPENINDNCVNSEFASYLKKIYVDIATDYIMAVEYNICNNQTNCHNYYSWVSV